jgi:FkbM family methyltransferase
MYYTQNNEEQIFIDYFKNDNPKDLCVLDIGANDGKTFSNSLKLIELGWSAVLIEPSPKAFQKLSDLHSNNSKVTCFPFAIANSNGKLILKESSTLLNQSDVALVSSLKVEETYKWIQANVRFTDVEVITMDFNSFYELSPHKKFDLISIDVEGFDYDVLSQIDLNKVNCRCLCVEFNGKNKDMFVNYVTNFGLKLIAENPENLIFIKK